MNLSRSRRGTHRLDSGALDSTRVERAAFGFAAGTLPAVPYCRKRLTRNFGSMLSRMQCRRALHKDTPTTHIVQSPPKRTRARPAEHLDLPSERRTERSVLRTSGPDRNRVKRRRASAQSTSKHRASTEQTHKAALPAAAAKRHPARRGVHRARARLWAPDPPCTWRVVTRLPSRRRRPSCVGSPATSS